MLRVLFKDDSSCVMIRVRVLPPTLSVPQNTLLGFISNVLIMSVSESNILNDTFRFLFIYF